MEQPQAIIGLLRRPDGALVVLTAAKDGHKGQTIVCADREALWIAVEGLLHQGDAPPVDSSAPKGSNTGGDAKRNGIPEISEEQLRSAGKTLMGELERQAKQQWGAPVVDAAATVGAAAAKRVQAALSGVSKRGPSRLYDLRKGRRAG